MHVSVDTTGHPKAKQDNTLGLVRDALEKFSASLFALTYVHIVLSFTFQCYIFTESKILFRIQFFSFVVTLP